MRKTNIISLLSVFIFFISASVQGQSAANKETDTKIIQKTDTSFIELIIAVPKLNEKNIYVLTDAINSIEGLRFFMFCPVHSFVLVKYSPNLFPQKEDVIKTLESKDLKLVMYIKQGNFDAVKEMCAN